jgi:predicted transcriptional regulator
MTVKEQVLEVITRMPDDSTLDDIGYELYVIESVQKGLAELDRGEYLTHEQAREKLRKWVQ